MLFLHAVLVLLVAPLEFRRLLDACDSSCSVRRISGDDSDLNDAIWHGRGVTSRPVKILSLRPALRLVFVLVSVITV